MNVDLILTILFYFTAAYGAAWVLTNIILAIVDWLHGGNDE